MKITDILKQNEFIFSCEFFPPKTEEGMVQLFNTVQELKELKPGYVSVTYGAGGGTRDKTVQIVSRVKHEIGIESMAHLTCLGHSKNEIKEILNQIKDAGIENIIALRGDPPKGEKNFVPHPDGFRYASELTEFIRSSYDFCIAVAGYPEGHIESPDKETDWNNLEKKISAGADFIITQLFFNNQDFFHFEKKIRERGIQLPIIPGIMPITNFNQIVRFTQMCGAKIPEQTTRELETIREDADAVHQYGIKYASQQCKELIAHGVPGIHFYTLNKSKSTKAILLNMQDAVRVRKNVL
jgi:methylenetetrahydrofolate reductase (NADPH)